MRRWFLSVAVLLSAAVCAQAEYIRITYFLGASKTARRSSPQRLAVADRVVPEALACARRPKDSPADRAEGAGDWDHQAVGVGAVPAARPRRRPAARRSHAPHG